MLKCSTFLCTSEITIIGIKFEGEWLFIGMVIVAFVLQLIAFAIGIKNSQISREILQIKIDDIRRGPLIWDSMLWTGIATIVWVCNIVFVTGNNLYIYMAVLMGNILGAYYTGRIQAADKDRTVEFLLLELSTNKEQAFKLANLLSVESQYHIEKKLEKKLEKKHIEKPPLDFWIKTDRYPILN
jgi:hypothetical protein